MAVLTQKQLLCCLRILKILQFRMQMCFYKCQSVYVLIFYTPLGCKGWKYGRREGEHGLHLHPFAKKENIYLEKIKK